MLTPPRRIRRRCTRSSIPRPAAPAAAPVVAAFALALLPGALVVGAPTRLSAQPAATQGTGRVAGTVVGEGGQPIVGAQVSVVGTRLGAVTGADGRYAIAGVPSGARTLRVQRIGFAPRTQPVTVLDGQLATADVALAASATQLTEVRVQAGYTNEARRDVSGAVTQVRAEETRDQKVATIEEALRGRVPGVQVQATGQPGRPASIVVRGQSSLGGTSPLYVVDGMYVGNRNPNLNPDDIATFDILKDASAAAQYGAQAANGVIVITTKRGQAGQNQFNVNAYYGAQTVPRRLNMAGPEEFQRVFMQAYRNAGTADSLIPLGVRTPAAVNTDWQDAIFQTGAIQNYNLQASGGTPTANYLISGSVLDQGGTVLNTNFRRASLRVNSQATRGRFTVGENIALSQSRQRAFPNGIFGNVNLPLIEAVTLPPVIPVRDSANPGGYGFGSPAVPTFSQNPVAAAEANFNRFTSNQVIGSVFGEVRLVEGLRYRLNLGLNYNDEIRSTWTSATQLRYLTAILNGAALSQARPNAQNLLYENLLTYDGSFGGGAHRVSAVAGQTSQRNNFQTLTAFRQGFTREDLREIAAGAQTGSNNNGFSTPFRTNALLSRVTYALNDRYLATASVRRDCSTRFSPANRCGVFGAGSLGYVMSEEGYFRNIPLLGRADFLKLRASTGVLGDQNINDFGYTGLITPNRNYLFGGNVATGATQQGLVNTLLTWQRNRSTDVGFDLGLLGNRLSVVVDYYQNTADQLLLNIPLPPSLGSLNGQLSPYVQYQALNPAVNAGVVRNAGLEVGVTHQMDRARPFSMNSTLTLTTQANRVQSLGEGRPIFSNVARTAVGEPIGAFYVRRTCGIFRDAAAVQAHTSTVNGRPVLIQPRAQPGDVCYQDFAGGPNGEPDGVISDADRYNAGNGTPKLTTGIFFEPRYRNFDFGLNLRGAFGFKIYNSFRQATENTSALQNIRTGLNPWSPENPTGTDPRLVFGAAGAENFNGLSDRWLERGDFVRLQNLVFGYTLPAGAVRRLRLGDVTTPRVYVNVQNVATFTGYSGFDPEIVGFDNPLERGIDVGLVYPNPRTVTFGFDLRF